MPMPAATVSQHFNHAANVSVAFLASLMRSMMQASASLSSVRTGEASSASDRQGWAEAGQGLVCTPPSATTWATVRMPNA